MRDHSLIAINKPSGLLSVPGRVNKDSALTQIRQFCEDASAVHRLDMDTSGILVYALNKNAVRSLGIQFEKRETRKIYIARVQGFLEGQGSIDAPMRCDWENRPLQIIDEKLGKSALTSYQSLEAHKDSSLMLLFPHTGRSHQLRVHMAHIGHPIVGDRFYGNEDKDDSNWNLMYLHASALSFRHPDSDETIELISVPDYAENAITPAKLLTLLRQPKQPGIAPFILY